MKILITGGTNGMGKGVAKSLAGSKNQSHELIILSRNKKLFEKISKEISIISNTKISFIECDLAKLSDVKKAVEKIQNNHDFLDALFINAGIGFASKRIETIDGMDTHFQVNYLSQFMLTLNLLNLLEKSNNGGRIIFNATKFKKDEIYWDDLQMKKNWHFENAIHQAMLAKRIFLLKLDSIYKKRNKSKLIFIGFQIHKTVWTNQLNIIPFYMKAVAIIMRWFGTFISIEKCGEIISPLLVGNKEKILKNSGKLLTWKKNKYVTVEESTNVKSIELQDKLWKKSLELCSDKKTNHISIELEKK